MEVGLRIYEINFWMYEYTYSHLKRYLGLLGLIDEYIGLRREINSQGRICNIFPLF